MPNSMIPEQYRKFGLVTIPNWNRSCFFVWESESYYHIMHTAGQPQRAYWSGDSLIVEMEDHIRIYHGLGTMDYKTIYR